MRVVFNFNGPNKWEKINFNSIVAVKISAVFEFNSTNSSSADSNHFIGRKCCGKKKLRKLRDFPGNFNIKSCGH